LHVAEGVLCTIKNPPPVFKDHRYPSHHCPSSSIAFSWKVKTKKEKKESAARFPMFSYCPLLRCWREEFIRNKQEKIAHFWIVVVVKKRDQIEAERRYGEES